MHKILKFLFIAAVFVVGFAGLLACIGYFMMQLEVLVKFVAGEFGTGWAAITIITLLLSPYIFAVAWCVATDK